MGRRWNRVLTMTTGIMAALAVIAPPARAADVVYVENVTAAADTTVSTCPWAPPNQVGLVCTDTYLLYFQARWTGETGPRAPWSLFIHETTWVSVSDEDFELVSERFGFGPAPDGFIDAQQLSTAAVRGTIPMSEGDPIAVDLSWDLSDADTQVSGNDGPIEDRSWGRNGRDGCMVQNWLAHQRWRSSYRGLTGSLGGVDVAHLHLPLDWPAVFIEGRSTFKIIINQTGVECISA